MKRPILKFNFIREGVEYGCELFIYKTIDPHKDDFHRNHHEEVGRRTVYIANSEKLIIDYVIFVNIKYIRINHVSENVTVDKRLSAFLFGKGLKELPPVGVEEHILKSLNHALNEKIAEGKLNPALSFDNKCWGDYYSFIYEGRLPKEEEESHFLILKRQ